MNCYTKTFRGVGSVTVEKGHQTYVTCEKDTLDGYCKVSLTNDAGVSEICTSQYDSDEAELEKGSKQFAICDVCH